MYRLYSEEMPARIGMMYVSRDPGDTGPIRVGDTVTVYVQENVSIYILVEQTNDKSTSGIIIGIGPEPQHRFKDWEHGNKISVPTESITAVIRAA